MDGLSINGEMDKNKNFAFVCPFTIIIHIDEKPCVFSLLRPLCTQGLTNHFESMFSDLDLVHPTVWPCCCRKVDVLCRAETVHMPWGEYSVGFCLTNLPILIAHGSCVCLNCAQADTMCYSVDKTSRGRRYH